MILTHYSTAAGLKVLDPSCNGQGLPGQEGARRRDYPELWVDRTYFGVRGYQKEPNLGNVRYRAEVENSKIYDYCSDPLQLRPFAFHLEEAGYSPFDETAQTSLYELRIYKAGFAGYINRVFHVVAKFTRTKVKQVS